MSLNSQNETFSFFTSLFDHSNRHHQTKFSDESIKQFCIILSLPHQSFEDQFLSHLSALHPEDPKWFISLFKEFMLYLNHPVIDSDQIHYSLLAIEKQWLGLEAMRGLYRIIMEHDPLLTEQMFYTALRETRIDPLTFGCDQSKVQFIAQLAQLFNKEIQWINLMATTLNLNPQEASQQGSNATNQSKLKEIFQQLSKPPPESFPKLGGQTDQIEWLATFTKHHQKDAEPTSEFDEKLKLWNRHSGQPLPPQPIKEFFTKVLDILIKEHEQKAPSESLKKEVHHQGTRRQFASSVLLSCMALYTKAFLNTSLNTQCIPLTFPEMSIFEIWRSISLLASSSALNLPASLKRSLFVYQKDLILLNTSIEQYLQLKSLAKQNPRQPAPHSFLDRVHEFLSLRYLEFDRVMGQEFSGYYQSVIENIVLELPGLSAAKFDHVLILSTYLIYAVKKPSLNTKMVQLIQKYESLPSTIDTIREIQGQSIISIYNETFAGFVMDNELIKTPKKMPAVRQDFLLMMRQFN